MADRQCDAQPSGRFPLKRAATRNPGEGGFTLRDQAHTLVEHLIKELDKGNVELRLPAGKKFAPTLYQKWTPEINPACRPGALEVLQMAKPPLLLKPEKLLGVAMGDAFLVLLGDRNLLQKGACLGHRLIGIIRREHDPIDTSQLQK